MMEGRYEQRCGSDTQTGPTSSVMLVVSAHKDHVTDTAAGLVLSVNFKPDEHVSVSPRAVVRICPDVRSHDAPLLLGAAGRRWRK